MMTCGIGWRALQYRYRFAHMKNIIRSCIVNTQNISFYTFQVFSHVDSRRLTHPCIDPSPGQ